MGDHAACGTRVPPSVLAHRSAAMSVTFLSAGSERRPVSAPPSERESDRSTGARSIIRLVIVDDHPIVLEGIAQLVRQSPDLELADACRDGAAALEAVAQHRPDVLLLDVQMPPPNGLAVLRELRRAGSDTRVILLTASLEDDDVLEAVRLGIRGLVTKDALADDLIACIRKVGAGRTCLDATLVGRAIATLLTREAAMREVSRVLTPREIEVVQMVGAGLRNRDIGERLFVSEGTIKVHLHHIYDKLGVASRDELIAYARAKGLVG
jgi:two-component system, NarL family, nitrate/nitrite response regulator NarL